VNNKSQNSKQPRNAKFCEKCKKTNHTIETCFWRIGFPAGYKKSSRAASSASLAEVDPDTVSQQSQMVEANTTNQFTFSKDIYQAILALLQQ